VLFAVGVVALLRWQASRPQQRPKAAVLDTRADVRLEFLPDEPGPVIPPSTASDETLPSTEPAPEPSSVLAALPPLASAIAIPRTLPAELMALLKKAAPARSAVVETAVRPAATASGGYKPPVAKAGPAWATGGTPVHGALPANQTIVYLLDASGSMGEWGKFDAARGALIATLRLQPPTVRFQIVVYAGTVKTPLRDAATESLPATAANINRAIDALHSLESPTGRSNHLEGLRAALFFHPDVVLAFTDADDLPAAQFRGLLKQAARPAAICLARVSARGIAPQIEVK
jgi:hypothetical protein